MTKRLFRSIGTLCLLALTSLFFSGCQTAPPSSEPPFDPDETGFESLFDGKTFGDWKPNERAENWKIEDGAMVGRGSRSHTFYMKEEFVNFEFRAEVMINKGGNSGIYFHCAHLDEGWPSVGHEGQINNTHRDPVKTGSLWGCVKNYVPPCEDDEWFDYSILVNGQNIVTRINGRIISDYTEAPGCEGGRKIGKGYIALQQHDPGSVVRFRNLRIKRLP